VRHLPTPFRNKSGCFRPLLTQGGLFRTLWPKSAEKPSATFLLSAA
jgi:hypothetical protein